MRRLLRESGAITARIQPAALLVSIRELRQRSRRSIDREQPIIRLVLDIGLERRRRDAHSPVADLIILLLPLLPGLLGLRARLAPVNLDLVTSIDLLARTYRRHVHAEAWPPIVPAKAEYSHASFSLTTGKYIRNVPAKQP